MRERIERILIAFQMSGVFRNNPVDVAQIFLKELLLSNKFQSSFK